MSQVKTIAFITGGNRGIGFETAKGLAERGVHVVIGARDAKQGEQAVQKLRSGKAEADYIVFNVTNPEDHRAAYNYFVERFGQLDILVNNAGIMIEGSDGTNYLTSNLPSRILRETFETNFFSLVGLTQTLLPLIRKSQQGRIVNLSSILGSLNLHSEKGSPIYDSKIFAYDASKTALNAFTVHLAHELRETKIKVNSAHPGWVKTEMGGSAAPMEISDGAKTSVQLSLLPADGPTGGFFHMGERLPW